MGHVTNNRPQCRQRFARSLMHGLITASACTTLLALAGRERAKTRLDREVDRLCAKDGGVHIYEPVKLPKENFGPDGEVFPQFRHLVTKEGSLGPDYRWTSDTVLLVEGDPSLTRLEQSVTRVRDAKTLGRRIVYIRGGGDAPGPWAPSGYSCRGVSPDLTKEVFIKEETK